MFIKLNRDILKKTLTRHGISDKIDAIDCIKYCREFMKKNINPDILQYAQPVYVKNNMLVVKVVNSLIAQEVQKHEQEIIDYLYRKANIRIKRIRFIS
jgi:hypothetical protein